MSELTPIDHAHAAMEAEPENETLRLRFYERVADSELVVALEAAPVGDTLNPLMFPVDGEQIILAFDSEARLTEFLGGATSYAAMPGRRLVQMVAEQGAGIGLNLEVAPSSIVLPHTALVWLRDTLAARPKEMDVIPSEIAPPSGLPERVLTALDAKLAQAKGLARLAYLVRATYESGAKTPLLAFIDALPDAQVSLAEATQEALTFAGIEAGTIDVAFFASSDEIAAMLARHGLRFDLPIPDVRQAPSAPGMDPKAPPKLK